MTTDPTRPLDLVTAALSAAECFPTISRNGQGRAFCPIKDGSTPNLSFCETDDGRVLIYCHGGCDAGDVVRALGLNMNDLFPDGVGGNTRVLEATYTYTDESGQVLYLKHRFRTASGGKTFTFEHPGEDGDFVTGRGDIAVPYNLEGVRVAIMRQERIFIVEGEKAVGALHREGLVATTSPHGAGGKKKRSWPEEWRRYFEGCAEIIILPDNDEAGRGFAAQAAALLEDSVEVVNWLSCPDWSRRVTPLTGLLMAGRSKNSTGSSSAPHLGMDRKVRRDLGMRLRRLS